MVARGPAVSHRFAGDDVCPICCETQTDGDAPSDAIVTDCSHAFHLGCILGWAEETRASTIKVIRGLPRN